MSKVICKDIDGNEKEVSSDEMKFRPSVYGLVIQNNAVLLSPQWDGYDFPGGGIDLHETLHEAVIREVKEETGIEVVPKDILHAETSFFWFSHSTGECRNCITLYFICEKTGGELSIDGFDEEEKKYAKLAEWVPIEKIDDLEFKNSLGNEKSVQLIRRAQKLCTP